MTGIWLFFVLFMYLFCNGRRDMEAVVWTIFEEFCCGAEDGVVGGEQTGVKRSYSNAEILACFYVDENDSVDWK